MNLLFGLKHKITKKGAVAIFLVVATLFSSIAVCLPFFINDSADKFESNGTYNSAEAIDIGDETYSLDPNGVLIRKTSGEDYYETLADISARSLCRYDDGFICVGTDGSIFTVNMQGEDKNTLFASAMADGPLAISQSEIWYKSGNRLMHTSGDEYPICETTLDDFAAMQMKDSGEIMLYADNPAYIVEPNGGEFDFEGRNDQYLTYLYSTDNSLLIEVDENLENDGLIYIDENVDTTSAATINGVSFPFADYPVGSFFTKNGRSCTCHNKGICVSSPASCNCMRYYPTGVKATCTIDLLSSQCYGFARFCQWRAYGYHDAESKKFYNAFGGTLSAGRWTANTIKEIFTSVGPGGHLRTGSGHSLFVMQVSSTGFITYECNMSTTGKNCIIYTRTWTWDSFHSKYGSRAMLYYNMPKDINNTGSVVGGEDLTPGTYQTLADILNMRELPTTESAKICTIPNGTVLTVTEILKVGGYYWGKTTYNDKEGWVRLDYAVPISGKVKSIKITSPPSKTTYFVGDTLDTSGLEVTAYFSDGTSVVIDGYTCSGYNMSKAGTYTVRVSASGFSDTFEITVKLKMIYPTSITLGVSDTVSIKGDNITPGVTILPTDATQRKLVWSSTDETVATVSSSGEVSINGVGRATITVTTENDLTASFSILSIEMPSDTEWSVDSEGNPLPALPDGIDPQDYSIRYRTKKSDGSYSEWVYAPIPSGLDTDIECQFRSFTMTFISDGKDIYEPQAVDVNTYIDISKYFLSKEGYLFAGWFTTNKAALSLDRNYAVGKEVKITGDLTLYAGWIEIGTITPEGGDPFENSGATEGLSIVGAGIRADEGSAGIRFYSRVSRSLLADIEKLHSDNSLPDSLSCTSKGIGYGTVVIMRSALSGQLEKGSSSTAYLSSKKALTVPAANSIYEFDDYIVYTALVNGYESKYYDTDFVARPYITYKDANGFEHTYYFTSTESDSVGGGIVANLHELADAAYASGNSLEKRVIEDYIYSRYAN